MSGGIGKELFINELLQPGKTIDPYFYFQQLTRLKQAIQFKRPELINRKGNMYHHDNVRPREKLRDLNCEIWMHPPYCPDLPYSDYHLFRPLHNSLNVVNLSPVDACNIQLDQNPEVLH